MANDSLDDMLGWLDEAMGEKGVGGSMVIYDRAAAIYLREIHLIFHPSAEKVCTSV